MKPLLNLVLSARYALVRRFGLAGMAGFILLAGAAVVAFYAVPNWRHDTQSLERRRLHLQDALARSTVTQKAVPRPEQQLKRFTAWFPLAARNAADLRIVADQARKENIALERGEYQLTTPDKSGFVNYEVMLPVKTDYARLRGFVAGVLNAAPHATLAELRVERRAANTDTLDARVHFTFVYRGE